MNVIEVLIVTGLSGAGRSHVGGVLEDAGFFVVDNLPPKMMLPLVDLMTQSNAESRKLAAVVDIRAREYFRDFEEVLNDLRSRGLSLQMFFVEANNEELVIRYEKVRRPHPLQAKGGSLLDAIKEERSMLESARASSDKIIDTTGLSIHDLSREVISSLGTTSKRELNVHVMSFGFKHGLPIDAEFVTDMRWLPNPFWVDDMRELTGEDEKVSDYVLRSSGAEKFMKAFTKTTITTFDGFLHENKQTLTVAFGCTGGKHRSVAAAIKYANELRAMGYKVSLTHRDKEKE